MKLNARQLRQVKYHEVQKKIIHIKRQQIYFILENIYDTYNVGGLFRLADAITAEKIYLCGQTEIPPNAKIKKASIGTDKVVPWEYYKSASKAIADLRKTYNMKHKTLIKKNKLHVPCSKLHIYAVEQSLRAVEYVKVDYQLPLALIFGNETFGILPETLALADQIVEIPMWGVNKSLNVIVSAAIVSYWIMLKIRHGT